ncbi:hypothetical protein ACFLTN_04245 [Chloroflexota bacterium]
MKKQNWLWAFFLILMVVVVALPALAGPASAKSVPTEHLAQPAVADNGDDDEDEKKFTEAKGGDVLDFFLDVFRTNFGNVMGRGAAHPQRSQEPPALLLEEMEEKPGNSPTEWGSGCLVNGGYTQGGTAPTDSDKGEGRKAETPADSEPAAGGAGQEEGGSPLTPEAQLAVFFKDLFGISNPLPGPVIEPPSLSLEELKEVVGGSPTEWGSGCLVNGGYTQGGAAPTDSDKGEGRKAETPDDSGEPATGEAGQPAPSPEPEKEPLTQPATPTVAPSTDEPGETIKSRVTLEPDPKYPLGGTVFISPKPSGQEDDPDFEHIGHTAGWWVWESNTRSPVIVQLSAVPNKGYAFKGWGGDVAGTASPITVTMDRGHRTVIAYWVRTHKLTVTCTEGGSVDMSSDKTDKTYTVPSGQSGTGPVREDSYVTLMAKEQTGHRFAGWSGDVPAGREKQNPLTMPLMDRDKSVTAHFESLDSDQPPLMTGKPTITPDSIPWTARVNVQVTIPVTTNTYHVAIRLVDAATNNPVVMMYVDNLLGQNLANITTSPVGGDVGQKLNLNVFVYGVDESVCSYYYLDPSRSSTMYTVEYSSGNIEVTNIPISWLTISGE